MSPHAVTVDDVIGHAALDAPRNPTGNGADLGAFPRALLAANDGSDGGSAHSPADCAANGSTARIIP